MKAAIAKEVKVADEVWIATALLHREHPEQLDFSLDEIEERAKKEALVEPQRPGVYQHIVQHGVANMPPSSGRYRILYETARGRRRLFRKGDSFHSAREGAKVVPESKDIPARYIDLLSWYRDWCESFGESAILQDPLLAMRNISKGLWSDEDPDEYVRRLREGWE